LSAKGEQHPTQIILFQGDLDLQTTINKKKESSKQSLPYLQTKEEGGIQTDPNISSNKGSWRHPNRAYHLFLQCNQHEEEEIFSEKLYKSGIIVFGIVIKLIPMCILISLVSTYGRSCKQHSLHKPAAPLLYFYSTCQCLLF
jgi:hypothetical protein